MLLLAGAHTCVTALPARLCPLCLHGSETSSVEGGGRGGGCRRVQHSGVRVRILPPIALALGGGGGGGGGQGVGKGQQGDGGVLGGGEDGSNCKGSWMEESLHLVLVHVDVIRGEDGAEGCDTWQGDWEDGRR